MKKLTIILLIFSGIHTQAQFFFVKKIKGNKQVITITREVHDFDQTNVAGEFDVTLIPSDKERIIIEIESNLAKYLETKVKNNKLIIRWDPHCNIRTRKKVKILLYYNELNSIKFAGSGQITNRGVLHSSSFQIKQAGSGKVNLVLDTKSLTCKMAGSGQINLKGNTRKLELTKAGSCDFYGYGLQCNNADISVAGSGDAEIYVIKKLKANLSGSGNIYYKGNPESVTPKVAGSGKIFMK